MRRSGSSLPSSAMAIFRRPSWLGCSLSVDILVEICRQSSRRPRTILLSKEPHLGLDPAAPSSIATRPFAASSPSRIRAAASPAPSAPSAWLGRSSVLVRRLQSPSLCFGLHSERLLSEKQHSARCILGFIPAPTSIPPTLDRSHPAASMIYVLCAADSRIYRCPPSLRHSPRDVRRGRRAPGRPAHTRPAASAACARRRAAARGGARRAQERGSGLLSLDCRASSGSCDEYGATPRVRPPCRPAQLAHAPLVRPPGALRGVGG